MCDLSDPKKEIELFSHAERTALLTKVFKGVFRLHSTTNMSTNTTFAAADDGTTAPTEPDYLSVDPPIPGQKFLCLSFISPEKVLPRKDKYFFEQFWRSFEDTHRGALHKFDGNIWECYQSYLLKNESDLEQQFQQQNDFQTSTRGLKVRGVYETEEEAKIRCQVLQKFDKTHSVFVAPVGYWLPWDPSLERIETQEYQLKQLNDLMKNYNQNEKKRDLYYEQQKEERKKAAMEDSERTAREVAEGSPAEGSESAVPGGDTLTAEEDGDGGGAHKAVAIIDQLERSADHTDLKEEFERFKTF